jgi:hypothetical protein
MKEINLTQSKIIIAYLIALTLAFKPSLRTNDQTG